MIRRFAALLLAVLVPALASGAGIRLRYCDEVAPLRGVISLQGSLPAAEVSRYIIDHEPTLLRMLEDGYKPPKVKPGMKNKAAVVAGYRERFDRAQEAVQQEQRAAADELLARTARFLSGKKKSSRRWEERQALLTLAEAYEAHRKHYYSLAQYDRFVKVLVDLENAGAGLAQKADARRLGMTIARGLAAAGLKPAGGERAIEREIARRQATLTSKTVKLASKSLLGAEERAELVDAVAGNAAFLPARNEPPGGPFERSEAVYLKARVKGPESAAILAAAVAVSGGKLSALEAASRRLRLSLRVNRRTAALLAFGSAVSGKDHGVIEALFRQARALRPGGDEAAARLAAAAAISGRPIVAERGKVEDMRTLHARALKVLPDDPEAAAILAEGAAISGKTIPQLKLFYVEAYGLRTGEPRFAALAAAAMAISDKPFDRISGLYTQANALTGGRSEEAGELIVGAAWPI